MFTRYRRKTLDIPFEFYEQIVKAHQDIVDSTFETDLSEHNFMLEMLAVGIQTLHERLGAEQRKERLVLTPDELRPRN